MNKLDLLERYDDASLVGHLTLAEPIILDNQAYKYIMTPAYLGDYGCFGLKRAIILTAVEDVEEISEENSLVLSKNSPQLFSMPNVEVFAFDANGGHVYDEALNELSERGIAHALPHQQIKTDFVTYPLYYLHSEDLTWEVANRRVVK